MIGGISNNINSILSAISGANSSSKSSGTSAFSSLLSGTGGTDSTSDVSSLFSSIDGNSDGSISSDEFSTTLNNLLSQLTSQLTQGAGGPPPGGHGHGHGKGDGDDQGFTLDQLQSQLSDIGSTDATRSGFIQNVVDNFSTADSDGDGKVTFKEAKTLNDSLTGQGTTQATTATGSNAISQDTSQMLAKMIQLLQQSYGGLAENTKSSATSSLLSVSA